MRASAFLGLALLGSSALPMHLALCRQRPELRVKGHWSEGEGAPGIPRCGDPGALLADPEVGIVVLCLEQPQREYWASEAARAGKLILTPGLPAPTYARLQRLRAEAGGADPFWVVRGLRPPPLPLEGVAPGTRFVSLRAEVPQAALRGTREGLLVHWGAYCLQLLALRHGALDSVYARTRSLGQNRPEEDLVTAQLRFTNGVEGLFSLVGLGADGGMTLEEWAGGEVQRCTLDWFGEGEGAWTWAYGQVARVSSGPASISNPLPLPLEGVRWAEWLSQSARLDREVFADEVVHG